MVLPVGCGTPPPAALLARADSAGVEVATILHAPADTQRLVTPAVRIGSTGLGGREHDAFELISDLALLPDERVAIIDNRGARVAVFDRAGSWLYDIGGPGRGPGEYTAPIRADARGDTLFVWDAIQRQFSLYTLDGTFITATPLPDRSGPPGFAAVTGGYVFEIESGQLMDPAPARGALVRAGRDGGATDTLVGPYPVPETGWSITDPAPGAGHMVNPPALAIAPPWTVAGERLIRLDPDAVTLEVRGAGDGKLRQVVRLPYVVAPLTSSTRDAYFLGLQNAFGLPDDVVARERTTTHFADMRPPVAGILTDDRHRLWVAEHDPAGPARRYVGSGWDVIDLERDQSRHVRFPPGFELKAVRDGRAYGITTLPNSVHVVDIFDLPPGGV